MKRVFLQDGPRIRSSEKPYHFCYGSSMFLMGSLGLVSNEGVCLRPRVPGFARFADARMNQGILGGKGLIPSGFLTKQVLPD
ncbi:MAG: hypothetical protein RL346_158 [Verrucomicrobiota bacterium]|jgi:hypothetical protein